MSGGHRVDYVVLPGSKKVVPTTATLVRLAAERAAAPTPPPPPVGTVAVPSSATSHLLAMAAPLLAEARASSGSAAVSATPTPATTQPRTWPWNEYYAARALGDDPAKAKQGLARLEAVVTKLCEKPGRDSAVLAPEALYELAEADYRAEAIPDAMALANALAAVPSWPGGAALLPDFREKCVATYLAPQVEELAQLVQKKDGEAAAYLKMLSICSTLDAWNAPQLDQRKNDIRLRWARKTLVHLRDAKRLDQALDIIEANRPQGAKDQLWLAPVVRAEKIDESNMMDLVLFWNWVSEQDRGSLLCRKAASRASDMPIDGPIAKDGNFGGPNEAWSAVWMLIDSNQGEKAWTVIRRCYDKNAIPEGYAFQAEFARQSAAMESRRYDEAIASADRLLAPAVGLSNAASAADNSVNAAIASSPDMLVQVATVKMRALAELKRDDEAKAQARAIIERWPDRAGTGAVRKWLEKQEKAGGAPAGAAEMQVKR